MRKLRRNKRTFYVIAGAKIPDMAGNILDKASRKARRRGIRAQAIAKIYVFYANAKMQS